MKEIEILVEIYSSLNEVKEVLNRFNYKGNKLVIDEYYYDPKRDSLKPDKNNKLYECLRLRKKENDFFITYKDDVFDNGKWLYSNEYETKVESIDIARNILEKLGFIKFIEINNNKSIYEYDKYEITLEEVKDLGLFLEVEYCTSDDVDVKEIKKEIQDFIDSLNINVSEELGMGKPELYLNRNKKEL